ncbi:hypothetical protein BKA59DRAFT_544457 [Fusarium tricinctum]|uniref:Uncharacterized protein n=1 Tax=Fusarium tricinctum TaxID=61284 RepID=A0A8K0RZS9_9HYPO|nr:hypothetical protein BKA59DRAFT_544457 [Fusarium tricinctum]
MPPNPEFVYCTICGMPLKGDCVVLSGPHWPHADASSSLKVADKDVVRYEAEAESYYGKLLLLPDEEEVRPQEAYDVNPQPENPLDARAKMYHGIHAACEDMANRVIKSSPHAKIHSIGDLWLTLERRCAGYLEQGRRQRPRPRDDNYVPPILNKETGKLGFDGYYVPSHCLLQYGDEWEGWWDKDPIEIPDLTSRLISNLEKVAGTPKTQVMDSMEASPEEINNHICSFLQNGPLSLECTYIMPQSQWAEVFFKIPFLWDLDTKAEYERTGSSKADLEMWDWEKLTRQVMSPPQPSAHDASMYNEDESVWSYSNVGLDVPGGFTNRRRIWQILEDMRPN